MSQLNKSFREIHGELSFIVEFEEQVLKQIQHFGKQLNFRLLDAIPKIHNTSNYANGNSNSYVFGYIPMVLQASCMIQYRERAPMPYILTYATWHHDASNCGVSHFHHVNSRGSKGMGSNVLRFLERYFEMCKRRFITCTVSENQIGADIWLKKMGYTEASSFKGGNSTAMCKLFVKDLDRSPIVKAKEINV